MNAGVNDQADGPVKTADSIMYAMILNSPLIMDHRYQV